MLEEVEVGLRFCWFFLGDLGVFRPLPLFTIYESPIESMHGVYLPTFG